MKRIAWASDIHLNFVGQDGAIEFCRAVEAEKPDALLLGGDLGEAPNVTDWLLLLAGELRLPIHFVLGNHDYYRGSIAEVRRAVGDLDHPDLHWLPLKGPVSLGKGMALVGHGGWGDARLGDYESSRIMMNDFRLVEELSAALYPEGGGAPDRQALRELLQDLGDEAAASLAPQLEEALAERANVFVLTHVPPFAEACWHEGELSGDDFLPYFACKATGDALLAAADRHPDRQLVVLCGHTHGGGQARLRDNLRVLTAAAEYGNPTFQILELEDPEPGRPARAGH